MNTPCIEVRNLEKHFTGFQLGPLNMTVPYGAIYGLIGPNGAGKTTSIDLMLGMGHEDAGQIKILGLHHRHDEVSIKQRTAYVSPDLNYGVWGTVQKAIQFVSGFYPDWDTARCNRLMSEFRLSPKEKIQLLSFGNRIKLSLLMALSRSPELIILDEPTVGLDAISRQQLFAELLSVVRTESRTVLISSHNLSDLERFADHVGIVNNGKLLMEGRMDEIVEQHCMVEFDAPANCDIGTREGFTLVAQDMGHWKGVVRQQPDWRQRLARLGATRILDTPVTLEELFIALVKNKGVL